eukprot:COSAG01_NODE_67871_length_265_cov_2.771084_1_plen_33_part_01
MAGGARTSESDRKTVWRKRLCTRVCSTLLMKHV